MTFIITWTTLLLLLSLASAQSIASFYTDRGPTIIALDASSSNLTYNTYSQKGYSSMGSIVPTLLPRNGSSLASVGYSAGASIYGSIFYQTINDTLAQLFFKCSYGSGNCINYGNYFISWAVTVPVKAGTGLSASLLSTDLGYRVTYEDTNGSLRQLSYSNSTKGVVTPWLDGAVVGNATSTKSLTLATAYTRENTNTSTSAQQTIYQISDDQVLPIVNYPVASKNISQVWTSAPSISTLPNWSSQNTRFGTTFYNTWMMLFYVDTTTQLQWIRSTDGGQTWQPQPLQDPSVWPLADTPNAAVSVSSSTNASDNSVSVFYRAGGKMVQATITSYNWKPYSIVSPASNSTATTSPTTTIPVDHPVTKDTRSLKIGASTGSAVGVVIIALALWWFLFRRKNVASCDDEEKAESVGPWIDDVVRFSGKAELDGHSIHIHELDHDPECLLLHQLQAFRMHELKGEIPVEMGNTEAPRPELDPSCCKCELDACVFYELPAASETRHNVHSVHSVRTSSYGRVAAFVDSGSKS